MVYSALKYHETTGLGVNDAVSALLNRLLWIDRARSTRKADRQRFVNTMDDFWRLVSKNSPVVADRAIATLLDMPRLFDKGIVVPREDIISQIIGAREAVLDMALEAADADMADRALMSLIDKEELVSPSLPNRETTIWFDLWCINQLLLESSHMGIPFHLWDQYLPLISYKFKRGARYLPKTRKTDIVRAAFSVTIPEVYALDIPDLLQIRDLPEFRNFRREVDKVFTKVLNDPQHLPDAKSLEEHFRTEYLSQIEKLALERRPKPGTILLRKLVSELHPIIGLVVAGQELYEECRDKYAGWRLALSALEMKGALRPFLAQR
jgi:hypothetical protein